MTLAAAVPLVVTLFSETAQHFPSKRAAAQMSVFTCACLAVFRQTHLKDSALLFNPNPDPGLDLSRSVPPSRSLIHEIMQLFLSQGNLRDAASVYDYRNQEN